SFGAAVRLDDADSDVHALLLQALPLLEHFVGLADAGGEAEVDLQPAPLLVADQRQEALRRRPASVRAHGWPSRAGNVNRNTVPLSGSLSQVTVPWWASAISLTMARPKPVPDPSLWPGTRKNFSNTCGKCSGGMPMPVSATDSVTEPFAVGSAAIVTLPP